MEIIYKPSRSMVKPEETEFSKHTVFLRKDIHAEEISILDSNETMQMYTYQEAMLTYEEFDEYSKLIASANAIKGMNDSKNITELLAGQTAGDNNQLIIMEAIADLYDAIANMTRGG